MKRSGSLLFKWLFGLLAVMAMALACKKKGIVDPTGGAPYNPAEEVVVKDFFPKTGGSGQQLVIYGENFGNDKSIVSVKIGGKDATIINVHGDAIYCIVPDKAYTGEIQVTLGAGQEVAVAKETFNYQKRMVVTTLAGKKDQRGNYDIKDGTFSDCGGFLNPSWLVFDPKDPNLLYMGQDGGDIRLLNFNNKTVTTPITRGMGGWERIRTIAFTPDQNYMIIANDQGDVNGKSTSILSRATGFKDPQVLTSYKQCNGASIHPVNGELYFNSYEKGQFYRFDLNRYIANHDLGIKDYQELFKIQDNNWEFNINIAPTGDYAYIIVINQQYILRTDYDWSNKTFTQPYVVCGQPRSAGWVDGVGTTARLSNPYQGVFVRNPDYAGKKDEYDFYFTEQNNHDIRILTPQGKVTTFAGRGSSSINPDPFGYIDGGLRTEARFDRPEGLAYDSVNHVFYVGDWMNRCVRKISLEN
ncbi:IPT/TIG domain-containing protein [Niabella pedocola]|uniref:IPT/TIG domain-containing protein n=1 Tax=Niabella pedocola TaxID=1752077 RepID=A0ABS8PK40_9BACT|nr:IPT/TIG domain-containing protein [Niabella pedocola]MCD2421466.1 IPT/TIG domain-containing protein [Niabella pedocola]